MAVCKWHFALGVRVISVLGQFRPAFWVKNIPALTDVRVQGGTEIFARNTRTFNKPFSGNP